MANESFKEQSLFYDHGYTDSQTGDAGFPDLKIVDYDVSVAGKRILNVGGGDASDIWYLASKNSIELLDASSVALNRARIHGVEGHAMNLEQPFPYQDKSFDIVIVKDILEHVYDSMKLLLESKRVCKDEGYIIISLPNHFYLPFRLRILLGGNMIWKSLMHNHKLYFEEWNYMHIRFFTWKGVKKMLQKSGLCIEKAYWDFGTLAHYSDPLMYEYAFKLNKKKIQSKKQWALYSILVPLYRIGNFVFPKWIRAKIVSSAPGLLCAGFYLRVKKI